MPRRVRFRLSKCEIEATRRVFEKKYESEDELLDDTAEDYLICKDVSPEQAEELMEKRGDLIFRYDEEKLYVVEVTREDHGVVASRIALRFVLALPNNIDVAAGVTWTVRNGQKRLPDQTVKPFPMQPAFTYPTVVVEVAASQSLQSVYRSATDYLDATTTIQIVLVVKLWKRSTLGGTINRRMLFMRFTRTAVPVVVGGYLVPDLVVSFGTLPLTYLVLDHLIQWGVPPNEIRGYNPISNDVMCSGFNEPPYVVNIPANKLFFGAAFALPGLVANGVDLDLYNI